MELQRISEQILMKTAATTGSAVKVSASANPAQPPNSKSSSEAVNLQQPSREQVEAAISEIKSSGVLFNNKLDFSIDEPTGRVVVQVVDRNTDELIREIPPEEVLKISAQIQEILGLLFDDQA